MRRKNGWTLMLLGLALMCGAAVLAVCNAHREREAEASAAIIVEAILGAAETMEMEVSAEKPEEDSVVFVLEEKYIGLLEIPSLELVLPVYDLCTEENLRTAPCRYAGSLQTGDLVIAGHNYSTHFGSIPSLSVGDEVRFTDGAGCIHTFEAAQMLTLEAEAVEQMREGEYPLTLFTCTYGGRERIVVRCSLREK